MRAIILCYHKVGPQIEEGRSLNVSPERLRSHASFFKRRGFQFVRAGEYALPWKAHSVCLTFDDAYWSTVEYGLPVLDSLGVPATLYAVTSLVGRSSTWDPSCPRPLANWESLADAQSRGHEIGNHTHSHIRLANVDFPKQVEEIQTADELLRSHGLSPQSFCYPYGSYNDDSVRALRQCGYKVGLALNKSLAEDRQDRLALSRIVLGFSDALPMLLYKVYLKPRRLEGWKA